MTSAAPLPMPPPSTKPMNLSCGRSIAQQFRGLTDFLAALDFFDTDIEEAHRRPFQIEQDARHGAAHDRERHRWRASPPIVAPRSSITESPAGRPYRRDRRAIDAGQRPQLNRAIAISAPVLPADTATSASPFFTASIASHIDDVLRPRRSAWLGLSCMLTATSVWTTRRPPSSPGGQRAALRSARRRRKAETRWRDDGQGNRGTRNDNRCADIATHGVKRDSNLLRQNQAATGSRALPAVRVRRWSQYPKPQTVPISCPPRRMGF